MKNKLHIMFCLCCLFGLAACFEDEGNYDYQELPAFYVDTVGMQTSFTVTQFSELELASHLVYAGDKSNLEFTWSIYLASTGQTTVIPDTLAKTENLSTVINQSPGNYSIEFCALERSTGVRATMVYPVTVESAVGTGLLVYYSKDGAADCDLIKTPLFNGTLASSTVTRQVYSQANPDYPLNGNLVGCGFVSYSNYSWVTLMAETDVVRLSSEDMSIMHEYDEMFLSAPEICHPEGYYYSNGTEAIVNNGKVYTDLISWSGGEPFFASARILMGDDYQSSPYAYVGYGGVLIAYDELKGRFLFGGMYSSEVEEIAYDPSTSAYDMSAIGKHCLYMDRGYSDADSWYGYAIMETPHTLEKYCYIYTTGAMISMCKGIAILDLTACENIGNARFYAFGRRGPAMYYVTENQVYVVNYDLSTQAATPPSAPDWTCPAGETITAVRMFTEEGIELEDSADSKYLLVATYNGTEGKVYILGADIVSGTLTAEPLETFDGFGEIKDMCFKSE